MNDADIGWTAGIIDGEGHIKYDKQATKTTFSIRIQNTDRKMLEKLHGLWGGNITDCTRKDRPRSKPIWIWVLYGRINAYPCLLAVYPHLVTKQEKAKHVIEYVHSRWGI